MPVHLWPGGPVQLKTLIRGPAAQTGDGACKALYEDTVKKLQMRGTPPAEGSRFMIDPLDGTSMYNLASWFRPQPCFTVASRPATPSAATVG